ncbi:hypothetical protein VSDG_06194 [Cytospora chrysosperma]|uniref:NCT transcriptional regulatory complex subunit A n=1 Tax=Cytospora chrysosperma TaxID=252740 RepID=A0A423VUF8_CYTCH|nr:hypothetical protein VSDG_06194 [Valsa sordida]
MPPRRAPASASAEAPGVEPSPVKTKFPTARIKRIMQADEEVGKVAQQTPIAVGKALEMFMIQMVTKSAEVAREKNSKRVTAAMLKTVVEADDQWDFLRDIVSKVEHEKEGSKGRAAKAESSDTEEDAEPKKKRGAGPGRGAGAFHKGQQTIKHDEHLGAAIKLTSSRDISKDLGASWQGILNRLSQLGHQQNCQQQAETDGRIRATSEVSPIGDRDANVPSTLATAMGEYDTVA